MRIHIYGNHLFYNQSIAKNLVSLPELKKTTIRVSKRFESDLIHHKQDDIVIFLESDSFSFNKEWLNPTVNGDVKIILVTEKFKAFHFQEQLLGGLKFAIATTDPEMVFRDVVLAVLNGAPSYYSREILNTILLHQNTPIAQVDDKPTFSPKEIRMINLFWEDKTKYSIAAEMNISVRTVESYRSKLMNRFNTSSFIGVVRTAMNEGVIA